jgi:hypothetical protein
MGHSVRSSGVRAADGVDYGGSSAGTWYGTEFPKPQAWRSRVARIPEAPDVAMTSVTQLDTNHCAP